MSVCFDTASLLLLLLFAQKFSYHLVGERKWFKSELKDDSSFISWCNAAQIGSKSRKMIVVKGKVESHHDDATSAKKEDEYERKESPDRRNEYVFDTGLSNPENWSKEQNSYAKQCRSSFEMLEACSLQFLEHYWQGYMVCTSNWCFRYTTFV